MKKILVPTDFSEYANNACFYAVQLASKLGAEIVLFHAYHIPIVDPLMPAEYLADMADGARKEVDNKMQRMMDNLSELASQNNLGEVVVNPHVVMGFATDEIVAAADKFEADMIIMGRRLTSAINKILIGSITSGILENTQIPLLIIPENTSSECSISNIMYASEFDEADKDVVELLLPLAKACGATLFCVHFKESYSDEQTFDSWQGSFQEEKEAGLLNFELMEANGTYEGITNYAVEHQIDLLAMLTHKRKFLSKIFDPSFTKEVAQKTDLPLLVFHPT